MAFFDDMTEQEIRQNKAIRGYIVRALAKGNQNSLLVRQVTNALLADNLITVPDISKQLSYLEDGGYIEFTDKRATAYNAYRRDDRQAPGRHQDGARRPARGHGQHLRRPLRVAQGGGLRD